MRVFKFFEISFPADSFMEIFPAIDLYEGKVVRLERGDYKKCKVYSENPHEIAEQWIRAGARWLHIVDLEGAREGEIKNWKALEKILGRKNARVQFGGGVRRMADVERLLKAGVQRVILGSKILDAGFLSKVTKSYGDRLALSLDLRGEEVQIEGWLRGAGKNIWGALEELRIYRVQCLIVTDIERDGTLKGMNLEKTNRLLEKSPFPVILSGGVASIEDIHALTSLKANRLEGVIVGKALYEGTLDLKQAIHEAKGKES